jgi:hypothetical protein
MDQAIRTIVINRKLSQSEMNEIRHFSEKGITVYSMYAGEFIDFAQKLTIRIEEKKELNFRTMQEVLQFGDLPIGDHTFSELFSIDNASIWHYHKFRIYFAVRNILYFLSPLQTQFEDFNGQIWFVDDVIKPLQNIYPEVIFRFPEKKRKHLFNLKQVFSYVILIKYRLFSYLVMPRKKPEYLLYVTEKHSTILNKHTLRSQKGHHILEYLISELDERFAILAEVLMPKPREKSDYSFSWKQFNQKWGQCAKIFLEGPMIVSLLKQSVRQTAKTATQNLEEAYLKIKKSELSITHRLSFEVFCSLHVSSSFFLYRYFAARDFFKTSALKAIIATDENSPLTKTILDAARYHGIKIIGIQHGTMHELHPSYLFTKNDRGNMLVPDLTLTWGSYWEQFLIEKGNYPKESVISVGQIRTDIIPLLLRSKNINELKATIVFASQPQRDPELRYKAAFDVFKAASQFSDVQLIIKLHPREFADSSYYSEIAQEASCSNYIFDRSTDLYQLIASCTLLITCFSTVGTETVYFHKPLIILDHLKQDIQGYASEGVAFQATDTESLTRCISGILNGTLNIDKQKYDAFIQKYAFRIDGKVAQRCINTISEI